jgi:hypothetical protein
VTFLELVSNLGSKMSIFKNIAEAPPIEALFMNKKYLDESEPQKVNLTLGGRQINAFTVMLNF